MLIAVRLIHTDATKLCRIGGVAVQQSEPGGGLGLLATQQLDANNVVVSVPTSLALYVEAPGGGPDDRTVRDYFDKKSLAEAPWYAQFAAYLCAMDKTTKTKGGTIDMRPWLESLPRSFDTPIHWTETARDELQYSHLSESVAKQEQDWNRFYNNLMMDASSEMSKLTFDDFLWGCECARSRAFSGAYTGSAFNPLPYAFTLLLVTAYIGLNLGTLEQAANGAAVVVCASILKDFVVPKLFKKKRYVICPLIDMANHKSIGTTGEVSFEFFGDAYSLAMSSGVSKNSEVYISYGARSNDQLLQYYGFVETDNPHDVYVMPPLRVWDISALEEATGRTFSPGRLEKLDRAGLLGSSTLSSDDSSDGAANLSGGVVVTRAEGVDPAVMQALRALVSTEGEWESAGQAIGSFAEEMSGGPENERMARVAARKALELELSSKPTTTEQDEELLKRMKSGKGTDPEDMLAVMFRLEKKKVLAETMETLQ